MVESEQAYIDNFDKIRWNVAKLWKTQSTKTHPRKIDNLNWPISIKKLSKKINNLPIQKPLGIDGFIGEFYQTFKEEMILIVYSLFQKLEVEEIHPNSFYEASILH